GFKENPRFDFNRLGASIGGPILKNKWFYYGGFEYDPLGQASSQSSLVEAPTAAGLSPFAGAPRLSANNFNIFKQYVSAAGSPNGDFLLQGDQKTPVTIGGQKVPLGTLAFASPNFTNFYSALISSDYRFSDRDQLRGRYIYNKSSAIDA